MTKKQIIWLLIRLAGLWFLWTAVTGAVTLMGSFLLTSLNPGLLERSIWLFLQSAGQVAINFAIGLYCIIDGRILFTLLNREDPYGGHIDEDNSDSSRGSSSPGSTLGLP